MTVPSRSDDAGDGDDAISMVVPIVPVVVTEPQRRRARTVFATGIGLASAVAALAACQPSMVATPPPPPSPYTPPPYTPPPYTPPPTTTTSYTPPETTTETTTTTTDPPSSEAPPYYVPGRDTTMACLPTQLPRGYVCTCNCVPD